MSEQYRYKWATRIRWGPALYWTALYFIFFGWALHFWISVIVVCWIFKANSYRDKVRVPVKQNEALKTEKTEPCIETKPSDIEKKQEIKVDLAKPSINVQEDPKQAEWKRNEAEIMDDLNSSLFMGILGPISSNYETNRSPYTKVTRRKVKKVVSGYRPDIGSYCTWDEEEWEEVYEEVVPTQSSSYFPFVDTGYPDSFDDGMDWMDRDDADWDIFEDSFADDPFS